MKGTGDNQSQQPLTGKPQLLDWINKAVQLRQQGCMEEALKLLNRTLEADPEFVRALSEKASLLESLNRALEAAVCYQKIIKIDPLHTTAWYSLGSILMAEKLYKEALVCFEKAIAVNPRHARGWYCKGRCLIELKRYEDAMEAYDKALQFDPKYSPAWYDVGVCLARMGRYEEALTYFEETLERDPRYADAWNYQGLCMKALERYQAALDAFDCALELEKNSLFYFNKAETLLKLGREEEALAHYDFALERRLEFPEALYMKIVLLRKMGRKKEALVAMKQFLVFVQEQDPRAANVQKWMKEDSETVTDSGAKASVTDRYEMLQLLSHSGAGLVQVVRSRKTKEVFALKTFQPESFNDLASQVLFRKEAKGWISLGNHPFIVQAFAIEEYNGYPAIVVEYIPEGPNGVRSLQDLLDQGPLSQNQILRWAIQVCLAMEYAFSKGLRVHGDLKASNIFLYRGQIVKVSDFGIAAAVGVGHSGKVRIHIRKDKPGLCWQSMENYSFGTPTCMSPEQFESAGLCDQRSDLYSFGVILYQMVSQGRFPFLVPLPQNDTESEKMRFWKEMQQLHTTADLPPLDSPLSPVIRRCLEKEPDKRYSTFQQLRSDLESFIR